MAGRTIADEEVQGAHIRLSGVGLHYFTPREETVALRDIDLDIGKGMFASIVGPSGCGKSTLLSLVSGMLRPTSGRVTIDGRDVTGPSAKVAYMLQQDHLFEWRDVLGNVTVGAEIRRMDRAKARQRGAELLERYGLGEFMRHVPAQLSGGMRQRVALIRTLVAEPDILLLDEPFSALDYQTRLSLSEEVFGIIKEHGKTAILVTHDLSEAISMADRVVVMTSRPGAIAAVHDIDMDEGSGLSPWRKREAGKYNAYFNAIWKELQGHAVDSV